MKMEDAKDKIRKYIMPLSELVLKARMNYEIWWELIGQNRKKNLPILNNNKYFWSSTIAAHYDSLVISLFKLYDKDDKSYNLRKVKNIALQNNYLSKKDGLSLNSEFEKAVVIWEKIRIIRHNQTAHKSAKLDLKKTYKQADIIYDQFKELIDISINIIKLIYGNTHNCDIIFSVSALHDIQNVLDKLKQ